MRVSDLYTIYEQPDEPIEVTLPHGEVVKFRRITASQEMETVRKAALLWFETARAKEQDKVRRNALGEIDHDRMIQACILAEATLESEETLDERRSGYCVLAMRGGVVFDQLFAAFAGGFVGPRFWEAVAAEAGKAPSPEIGPGETDSQFVEIFGEDTPTS